MRHFGFALLSRGRAVARGMMHYSWPALPPNGQMMRRRAARIRVIGGRASPDRAIATRGCGPLQLGLCVPVAPRIARILRLILDFQTPFHEDREGRLASWRITALDPTPRPPFVFSACRSCFIADWSHDFTRVRAGARFRAYDRRAAWTGPAAADTLRSRGFQAAFGHGLTLPAPRAWYESSRTAAITSFVPPASPGPAERFSSARARSPFPNAGSQCPVAIRVRGGRLDVVRHHAYFIVMGVFI